MTSNRPENPAKVFLRQYRALCIRADGLSRAIDEAKERAMSTAVRLKPIMVQGGGGAYDRMAEDVCRAADASESLYKELIKAQGKIREILDVIAAVPDEMQKAVLTLRYIEGLDWITISQRISYEERQTFVIHGRALLVVNEILKSAGKCS